MTTTFPQLQFELPSDLEATAPTEARGQRRDDVRLLVSHYQDDAMDQAAFWQLADYLSSGDVVVINTSGTVKAALPGLRAGRPIRLHVSTIIANDPQPIAVVELRQLRGKATQPLLTAQTGEIISLPDGWVQLLAPHNGSNRLWLAKFELPLPLHCYLERHGEPIRYNYVREAWSIDAYQTVFSQDFGSAEMPSAGRAFTPELVTRLVAKGVQFAPVTLHTGVASLEEDEPPYEEWFSVSAETATLLNRAKQDGRRIIAIGTTAVRAVESAVAANGAVQAASGWTERIITPAHPPSFINGLLTGFHEPKATHLAMLAAIAGMAHLEKAYALALTNRYLWHEFGDLHLLVA